jgi:flavodoxin I
MKAMVVYDSAYGNTEQIAQAIGKALGALEDVETRRVGDVQPERLTEVDLLIVGSPTQRFRPTPATTNLLKRIPNDGLEGVKVAGFDTRFSESEINKIRILAFFVRIFGYAAQPITDRLEKKGGELVVPAEGFYVADTEGPLLEGELERAAEWAKEIVRSTT